ncbi:hypothetical protein HDU79_000312 [Rhizoclosmatium sp. JEL0117]|nr:hypothetical protein HDU79_000312 [Rhizoclosmatium sp. JEL0117]
MPPNHRDGPDDMALPIKKAACKSSKQKSFGGGKKWTESNWRRKVSGVVSVFCDLNLIHFKDCWEDWDYLAPSCYMNGVDIEVTEARPLDAALFSHKFKSAGYRFQVATALGTSKIVYISGGTPCGMFNDLDQAQRTLLLELEDGEKVAADKGYRGDPRTITKLSGNSDAVKSHNRNITLMGRVMKQLTAA